MSVLCVGIDPGSTCGVIVLAMPAIEAPQSAWRYHAHLAIAKPQRRVRETEPECEIRFTARIAAALHPFADAKLAVIEKPKDAAAFWGGQGQTGQGRGTAFGLGVHYSCANHAVAQSCRYARLHSYPVLGTRKEPGWMPRATKREHLLAHLALVARGMGAPPDMPEHCAMSLGVLLFHLTTTRAEAA